jgi:hypothetical protein
LGNLDLANASRIPDIFSDAPKLHRVRLGGGHRHEESVHITIPWGQIAHYAGRYRQEHQLEILRTAPNLVECTLYTLMQEPVDCDPNANPMVSLPHLRKLRLKNLEYLRLTTAPNLESLSALFGFRQLPYLLSFMQRSSCALDA